MADAPPSIEGLIGSRIVLLRVMPELETNAVLVTVRRGDSRLFEVALSPGMEPS